MLQSIEELPIVNSAIIEMQKSFIDLILDDWKTKVYTIFELLYSWWLYNNVTVHAEIGKEWEYFWWLRFLNNFLFFVVFNYSLLWNVSYFLCVLLLGFGGEVAHYILSLNLTCFLIDSWGVQGEWGLREMESIILLDLALSWYVFSRRLEWNGNIVYLLLVHLNWGLFFKL
jgi:hypothetical protein